MEGAYARGRGALLKAQRARFELRGSERVAQAGNRSVSASEVVGMRLPSCFETDLKRAPPANDFLLRFVGKRCFLMWFWVLGVFGHVLFFEWIYS